MRKFILALCLIPCVLPSRADNNQLREEIAHMKKELERCKKMHKVWVGTAVVGGVAATATGVAAISKQGQIKEKQQELQSIR